MIYQANVRNNIKNDEIFTLESQKQVSKKDLPITKHHLKQKHARTTRPY